MDTPILPMLATALFLGPMLVAASCDAMTFRIPNLLPLFSVLSFLAMAGLMGWSGAQWSDHLLGGACGLALGMAAFAVRAMGGGDGKLLAAASLWAGLSQLLALLVVIGLAGGALALGLVVIRNQPLAVARFSHPVLQKSAPIPYAIAIASGCLWVAIGKMQGL